MNANERCMVRLIKKFGAGSFFLLNDYHQNRIFVKMSAQITPLRCFDIHLFFVNLLSKPIILYQICFKNLIALVLPNLILWKYPFYKAQKIKDFKPYYFLSLMKITIQIQIILIYLMN